MLRAKVVSKLKSYIHMVYSFLMYFGQLECHFINCRQKPGNDLWFINSPGCYQINIIYLVLKIFYIIMKSYVGRHAMENYRSWKTRPGHMIYGIFDGRSHSFFKNFIRNKNPSSTLQ